MPKCQARRTDWEKTGARIGSSYMRASIARMCENYTDGTLCTDCSGSMHSKYESKRVHGLISPPIPLNSMIYGSEWYWKQVAVYGSPPQSWVEKARASCGNPPEETQSIPIEVPIEEMKKKEPVPLAQTILAKFAPITRTYQESKIAPRQLPTDTLKITKKVQEDGSEVWETECGLRFTVDTNGEPGELIT